MHYNKKNLAKSQTLLGKEIKILKVSWPQQQGERVMGEGAPLTGNLAFCPRN